MNIADYKKYAVLNGIGLRHSIFVSGCNHYCKGCFNSKLADYTYGQPFTQELRNTIINDLNDKNVHVQGLSLLGGCPFCNAKELLPFITLVKSKCKDIDIWAWSGETYEEILIDKDKLKLLKLCDILVDGRFEQDKKDLNLNFRGSSNQRIIKVQESLKKGKVILSELNN